VYSTCVLASTGGAKINLWRNGWLLAAYPIARVFPSKISYS
jgi:hypothetical protein